jgi:hypothetical protein
LKCLTNAAQLAGRLLYHQTFCIQLFGPNNAPVYRNSQVAELHARQLSC